MQLEFTDSELVTLLLQRPPPASAPVGVSSFVPHTLRAWKRFTLPDDTQAVYNMPILVEFGAVLSLGYNAILSEI